MFWDISMFFSRLNFSLPSKGEILDIFENLLNPYLCFEILLELIINP